MGIAEKAKISFYLFKLFCANDKVTGSRNVFLVNAYDLTMAKQ